MRTEIHLWGHYPCRQDQGNTSLFTVTKDIMKGDTYEPGNGPQLGDESTIVWLVIFLIKIIETRSHCIA